jgi:bifunctional DNA-binding transcriptional regulator/antitoxin component of YhaV-PrlF toxin-antitoxin module
MPRTIVSPDYHVEIPEETRREVPIEQGQAFEVIAKGNGIIMLVPERPLDALRGIAKGIDIEGLREKHDRL